jgi:hypothetical protein
MSYRFVNSFRAGSGWNCSPKHVEFRAKNKFAKLVHLVGLIIKKCVTMHGHMNVKKGGEQFLKFRLGLFSFLPVVDSNVRNTPYSGND